MKRLFLVLVALSFCMISIWGQEKRIAVLVTTKNVPEEVNTQPAIDAFMKALGRSGYTIVDRTADVLKSIDFELSFQALLANKETMAKIGKVNGANYICNIDISYSTIDKDYYFSVHMVDVENTDADCVTYYPENSWQKKVAVLKREEMQRASLYLIRDLDNGLHFMNDMQRKSLQDDIDKFEAVIIGRDKDRERAKNKANGKALGASLVPGLGLFQKGYNGEGTAYLLGDIALIGGGVGMLAYANYQKGIMEDRTTDYDSYNKAVNGYNTARTTSIVCFGCAGAIYIINLIRAYTAQPKKGSKLYNLYYGLESSLLYTPQGAQPEIGFTLAYKF